MFRSTKPLASALTLLLLLITLISGSSNALQAAPGGGEALPQGIVSIPGGKETKVDGVCDEYGDALAQPYSDAGGTTGTVYLKHDGTYIYACIKATAGSFKDRFASIYLDPQGDGAGYIFAQQNDYSLRVGVPGASDPVSNGTFNGTGVANGYTPNSGLNAAWSGQAVVTPNGESFEYRISAGRFFIEPCRIFGIAAYHHWVSGVGDDYGWPSNRFFDQPRTWQLARMDSPACGDRDGRIAYVFRGNTDDATSFFNLLTSRGYSVTLVPLTNVLATDFSVFDLIIIADDSGDLDRWGIPPSTAAMVAKITEPNKPILGLGEGGYAFFGQLSLFIGWPNGWHGPQDSVKRPAVVPSTHYTAPNAIAGDPVKVYTQPVNEVGIYLNPLPLPSDVVPFGLEVASPDHSNLILQGCRQLWGFSGNPTVMTDDGKNLFINTVEYGRRFQCGRPVPPQPECSVKKSANPPHGTPVTPGQVIEYTIEYVNCKNEPIRLVDTIPADTIYVPGSASDGIAPGADGSLVWVIGANASGVKKFRVWVSDTQCHNQRRVNNRAGLLIPGSLPVTSNVVSHPVECPPVHYPNDEPPYAEQEVSIHPYPLITGTPSTIKVRLTNSSSTPQPVKVSFQTSPQRFGIGITFNSFDTRFVTIPANSSVIVQSVFTPVSSGHYCIQIKVEDASPTPKYKPILTQRNLDVTENLKPGVKDDLVFKVANPTNVTTDIKLVVVNTCPGWVATVSPALLSNVGPNGSDVRDATLSVTPPNPVTLGSGCHIDVQGWIGDQLIGGIRKLDVPPVHLPPDVNPPWLEPEISTIPSPPVIGQPAQICVEQQNPLSEPKNVTFEYQVADFGAGIPFTTVGTKNVTLPPNSNAKYCVAWTPAPSNNLHRCLRVILKQPGYLDMASQRNLDLRRIQLADIAILRVPVLIGNTTLVSQPLKLNIHAYGIIPDWEPILVTPQGDPAPDALQAGQQLPLELRFRPRAAAMQSAEPAATRQQLAASTNYRFGDESRVDVGVVLGDEEISGFTVVLDTRQVYMPMVAK